MATRPEQDTGRATMEECECGHGRSVHNLGEGRCYDQACDCQEFVAKDGQADPT